jgi:predicted SAM-dependent methyltransferase
MPDMPELTSLRKSVHRGLSVAKRPINARSFRTAVDAEVAAGRPLKINVGAGGSQLPGWINTDVTWRNHYLNLMEPWPVPPESVAYVYSDNVIEHFTIAQARVLLPHMFAALRPGGVVRMATPDVERTARAYLENGELAQQHLQRHADKGYAVHHPVDLLRVTFVGAKHYLGFVYDFAALQSELERAGFSKVERREANESPHEEFAGLEARVKPSEAATALIVEAQKA